MAIALRQEAFHDLTGPDASFSLTTRKEAIDRESTRIVVERLFLKLQFHLPIRFLGNHLESRIPICDTGAIGARLPR